MYVDCDMEASRHIDEIYIDGKLIYPGSLCTALDTNEGWVEIFSRNEDGSLFLNKDKTEIVRERLYGNVLVKFESNYELQVV